MFGLLKSSVTLLGSGLVLAFSIAVAALERPDWPAAESAHRLDRGEQRVDLEVAVVVFGDGIERHDDTDARHTLRRVETRLAAAALRDVLTEGERFGAVRVLPAASQFAALTVTGQFVHSDGRDLVLAIRAVDATGRLWLARTFRATASLGDYAAASAEPFRPLFVAIANALWARAQQLTEADLRTLSNVAQLRYGAELAPTVYQQYLRVDADRVTLARLPAESDPMFERIRRIRNQEALFIDTVDEQYVSLREALGPTYRLWRQSSLEQAEYLEDYRARASQRELRAERGSFAAMQQVYGTYRSVRIQEQDLFELATGFDNETRPTVLDSGERLVRLEGSLAEQYQQWRSILSRIIELERGLP